jgi:hypothetical protein
MPVAVILYKWFFVSLFSGLLSATPAPAAGPAGSAPHPFYVSVTEINHNAASKSLEISCRIFADDMEDVLKQQNKTLVDFTDAKQQARNDGFVSAYISRHLALKADGKPVPLSYVGFEKDKESVYCYFEVTGLSAVKKLDVSNSILQDYIDKQINIIHVTVGGNRKSYKLDYPKKDASFAF